MVDPWVDGESRVRSRRQFRKKSFHSSTTEHPSSIQNAFSMPNYVTCFWQIRKLHYYSLLLLKHTTYTSAVAHIEFKFLGSQKMLSAEIII